MGIPSYFSYIIKNHTNIIRNLEYHRNVSKTTFHALYMDCNSIIYDAIHKIEADGSVIESEIVANVIIKIKQYVETINPTELVYIAFDGVAPYAKMEQQRVRRYKSAFMATIDFENGSGFKEIIPNNEKFSTCAITPGTTFMDYLSKEIEHAFGSSIISTDMKKRKYIVSTSNEAGEGEHKMFHYMRSNAREDQNIAVYGLDADLIMLSIIHALMCKNIYIFREAPEFSLKILQNHNDIKNAKSNEPLFIDVEILSKSILKEMNIGVFDTGRIYDYIFICFMLGNDFLPHFPALNIRTKGIDVLLDYYEREISRHSGRYLISSKTGKIQWRWVYHYIHEMAKREEEFIVQEYHERNNMCTRLGISDKTAKDRETMFENTPMLYREDEHYICPGIEGWQSRYYKIAFGEEPTPIFLKKICVNYLEGLEWVFKYYTEGCVHWRWKYKYSYPPLLSDLIKYIPQFESDFFVSETETNKMTEEQKIRMGNRSMEPYKPIEQLVYVLPSTYHYLLPRHIRTKLENEKYRDLFSRDMKFQWMFCRYFWECHLTTEEIPQHIIENICA